MKRDIKSMLFSELAEFFESTGEPGYRTKQVFSALHKGVTAFSDMKNLSLSLREILDSKFFISSADLLEKQVSETDNTEKYLWRVQDDDAVECVLMEYEHGVSVCISTQVGCRMGCIFCASSLEGLKRNLTASEMLDQVIFTQLSFGRRISNVVLMGIGEPLDNFDNVMRFIKLINDPNGIKIGARHITLSTCGIIESIDKLLDYDVQLTLAISLHAPDDETRTHLVPANGKYGVKELINAGERYFKKTGRRVTYEYAMIDGVNDSKEHAMQLSLLLKGKASHLNLITLSDVKERGFNASTAKSVSKFTEILKKNGMNFTIRRSLGADIEASCGQLRRRILRSENGNSYGVIRNN